MTDTGLFASSKVAPKTPKRTEIEMLNMLRTRFTRPGNGGSGEYAFMTHVRNSAGFNSTRTFDAVVMNLWPSRGLELHAYEVKCNRSDWLRELKEPAKAEAAARVCDRFSMVVADDSIIAAGELPGSWGLLVARGSKLVCVKEAPLLPDADPKRPVRRDFLVALLRSGGAVPQAEAEEVRLARDEGRRESDERHKDQVEAWREERDTLRATITAFEQESGVRLSGWRGHDAAEVGKALRSILNGEKKAEEARTQLERAQQMLRRAADELAQFLNPTGAGDEPR